MSITFWRKIPGFKIKRKSDLRILLSDVVRPGNTYRFIVNDYKVVSLYVDKEGVQRVTLKTGEIYDPFNPEVMLYGDDADRELWAARRVINETLFTD